MLRQHGAAANVALSSSHSVLAMRDAIGQHNDSSSSRNCLAEFANSALYGAAVEPVRGLAQTVDHFAGTNLDQGVKAVAGCIGVETPTASTFGTTAWYGQQLGGAIGLMVPYMILHRGVKAGASFALGESTINQSMLDAATNRGMLSFAGKQAGLNASVGLLYGSILHPGAEEHVGTSSFYSDRLINGAGDMVAFGAWGFTNPYVGQGLGGLAGLVEKSSLMPLAKAPLSAVLGGPILPGAIANIPGGVINAEVGAWKDGRPFASGQEQKESIIGMTFVGGALGTANWLGAEHIGTNSTNARHLADRINLTRPDNLDAKQAEFRIIDGGTNRFNDFYNRLRQGSDPQQVSLEVRTKLHGLTSDLFGEVFSTFGNARSILLDRGANDLAQSSLAGTVGLIGTCTSLLPALQSKDVFQGRSTDGGPLTVWLQPKGADHFTLSRGEPITKPGNALTNDLLTPVHLGNDSIKEIVGDHPTKKTDLVFGVGGVVASHEGAGAIRAFEEVTKVADKPGLVIDTVTGGSAGAVLAAMYTNGMSGEKIFSANLAAQRRLSTDPFLFWRSMIAPQPEQWNLSHSFLSLEGPWADEVTRLNMVPNDQLQMFAFAPRTGQPVLFKGKDYPATMPLPVRQSVLGTFLAATGSYPDLFAPVRHNGEWLLDGGLYKANPDEFSQHQAIVMRFTNNPKLDRTVSKPDSLVIDLTRSDVDELAFNLSENMCRNLFEDGYNKTAAALKQAIADGRLTVQ